MCNVCIKLCEIECMCGNKDLGIFFQKYESFYAKYVNYKCNLQFLLRVKV
jgi:hypothetical protein